MQMLTPCPIGNGWLKVRNFGTYGVTLFNKHTGEAARDVEDNKAMLTAILNGRKSTVLSTDNIF